MMFREIITVYSGKHMIHINTLCSRMQSILMLKKVVYIVTTLFYRVIVEYKIWERFWVPKIYYKH
jgi:hypothetical protein